MIDNKGTNNPMFGRHHSAQTKQKISLAKKGKPVVYITGHADYTGDKNPFWGKHHTEESKAKMSLANKGNSFCIGRVMTDETKELIGVKAKERYATGKQKPIGFTEQARKIITLKLRERLKNPRNHPQFGKPLSPSHKAKFSRLGWKHSEETKAKLRQISRQHWEDRQYVLRVLAGLNVKPNKAEQRFIEICQRYNLPYIFNGANADVIIGRRIPDFININGRKQVIEIFGKRWHDLEANVNIHPRRTEEATIEHYERYGFQTLIIWESELKDPEAVKEKLLRFESNVRHKACH